MLVLDVLDASDASGYRLEPRKTPGTRHNVMASGIDEGDDDDETWFDEESRLRPPALQKNLESALAGLPGISNSIRACVYLFLLTYFK